MVLYIYVYNFDQQHLGNFSDKLSLLISSVEIEKQQTMSLKHTIYNIVTSWATEGAIGQRGIKLILYIGSNYTSPF